MTEHIESPAPGEPLPLSIVVIAENEEDRIGACLASVLATAERAVPAFEVILIDSASTDRTVEIASEYPITILRIPSEHTIAGGAGRHVGEHVARGERILHVDGDTILTESWLPAAVDYLDRHDDVAAVEGHLNESDSTSIECVDRVHGVMLFDAAVLQSVGGFDPFLESNEDIDLGFRLEAAGYRQVRLPKVSASHPEGGAFSEPFRRWRAGYYRGPGQAIRKSLSSPRVLRKFVVRQRYKLLALAWFVTGIAATASIPLTVGWLLLTVAGVGLLVRELGVADGIQFVLSKSLGAVGLFWGLWERPPAPESYPIEAAEVVEEGTVIEGDARSAGRREG